MLFNPASSTASAHQNPRKHAELPSVIHRLCSVRICVYLWTTECVNRHQIASENGSFGPTPYEDLLRDVLASRTHKCARTTPPLLSRGGGGH
ncbi:hypothetical protein ARTHRO9AX_210082 [Arthrobacter sp. 9AX]|nr:hypothetical protein ARTHRO9AX_210082 [Arthrobacter sp. 9AX]